MVPKGFFVTSGRAVSPTSELNAFDLALKNAGIAQYNLVPVTSIIPPNCKEEKEPTRMVEGTITFAVVARMDGSEGTIISAGIAWAWEKNKSYGIVAEAHGHMDKDGLRSLLEWKIKEMAKIRNIEIGEIRYRVESLKIPMDNYGSVVAALVYIF